MANGQPQFSSLETTLSNAVASAIGFEQMLYLLSTEVDSNLNQPREHLALPPPQFNHTVCTEVTRMFRYLS